MSEVRRLLRRSEIFGDLSDLMQEQLAAHAEVRTVAAGEIFVRAGSPQTAIVHLSEGRLALYRSNPKRKVTLLLGIVSAPAIIGDAECAAHSPWMVSVRAEDDARLLLIENSAFLACVQQNGVLAHRLYLDACTRHLLANHTAQSTALHSVETRLLGLLLDLARRSGRIEGDRARVGHRVSKVDLAAALGVTRKTITRTLAPLEKAGLIAEDENTREWVLPRLREVEAMLPEDFLGLSSRIGELVSPVISRWSWE
jgi:CRP/FNR family transcriptional regulator, cyclic AMP receptor protein